MSKPIILIDVKRTPFKLGVFKEDDLEIYHVCWYDTSIKLVGPPIKTYGDFDLTQMYAFAFRDGYEAVTTDFQPMG